MDGVVVPDAAQQMPPPNNQADEVQEYNSDDSDEQFDFDGLSEGQIPGQLPWIQWFCSLEGHEFLAEIDENFIRNHMNLYGLQETIPKPKMIGLLRMILSPKQPSDEQLTDEAFLELNQEASDLYGLIHARYIQTPRGRARIFQKFLHGMYGSCPRALCDRQRVLPVGLSDQLRVARFKIFCPRCEEVYVPKYRQMNIDGAYFGTSFPHQFIMNYTQAVILPPKIYYHEPKIFGFRVAGKKGSKYFNPQKGPIKYVDKVDDLLNNQIRDGNTNMGSSFRGGDSSRQTTAATINSARNHNQQAKNQQTSNNNNNNGKLQIPKLNFNQMLPNEVRAESARIPVTSTQQEDFESQVIAKGKKNKKNKKKK